MEHMQPILMLLAGITIACTSATLAILAERKRVEKENAKKKRKAARKARRNANAGDLVQ